jgi:hypothetical protein
MRNARFSRWGRAALLTIVAMAMVGCTSTVALAPLPPEKYEKLGYVTGNACGHLLFGDWALAFIPIKLSERVQTARQKALAKAPGATDLMNVTITENWTYWLIGSSRCVVVSGEAIKS